MRIINDRPRNTQAAGATVRSVAPVGRDGQEFAVTFDSGTALTLTATVIVEFGIAPGKAFQAGDLDALRHADVRQRATEAAVRYLGMRPRSTHEIRDYLHRKGYSPETVDTAVGRLTERGYLDDAAFARWWAENRAQFRPRGPHLLRQELRRRASPARRSTRRWPSKRRRWTPTRRHWHWPAANCVRSTRTASNRTSSTAASPACSLGAATATTRPHRPPHPPRQRRTECR